MQTIKQFLTSVALFGGGYFSYSDAIPGWRKPYGLVTNAVDNIRATEWIAYRPVVGMTLLVR